MPHKNNRKLGLGPSSFLAHEHDRHFPLFCGQYEPITGQTVAHWAECGVRLTRLPRTKKRMDLAFIPL